MPHRLFAIALLGLLLPLTACQGDAAAGGEAPGDSTAAAGEEAGTEAVGTYRAYFIISTPTGYDTTDVMEGDLAAPVPASEITSIDLPAHGDNIRVTNETWPLPDGLGNSAFLLSYREPDGDLSIYSTDFDVPRFCNVNADTTELRAIAIGPMWSSQAASHPLAVFNVGGTNDSLATFTVLRPAGDPDAHTTQISAASVVGQNVSYVVLETHWNDGRARPLVLALRGQSGDWYASLMEPNQSAVPQEGVQFYKDDPYINAEHPMLFVAALDE